MTLPDHVGLSPDGTKVRILDQSLLPGREVYLELDQLDELIEAIQSLRVRGAPAIGIFAGYALYVLAQQLEKSAVQEELPRLGEALSNARPTAVNLSWAVRRMLQAAQGTRWLFWAGSAGPSMRRTRLCAGPSPNTV